MNVPPLILKSVAFVGFRKADGSYHHAGSAVILGRLKRPDYCEPVFFVTAKHVIQEIGWLGLDEVFLRVNTKLGRAGWCKTMLKDWFFHPTDDSVDVAIVELGTGPDIDHLVTPIDRLATPEFLEKTTLGPGDEVVIMGLFKHHAGRLKCIPIVRTGNIACLPGEKIKTKHYGWIDGFLIEARSLGGLSGSPVFALISSYSFIRPEDSNGPAGFYFLGLIHGHYDARATEVDVNGEGSETERVNTGIAIVVPAYRVLEVIEAYEATGRSSRAIIHLLAPEEAPKD